MPYSSTELGEDYTPLVSGTHEFAYNKVVSVGILIGAADFTDVAVWDAFTSADIAANVKIVKDVIGSYDGGQASQKPGYGNTLEVIDDMVHTLPFRGEYNKANRNFVEKAMLDKNVGICFWVGDYEEFNVVPYPVSFTNNAPVTEELNKVREFNLSAKWSKIEFSKVLAVNATVKTLFKP